MSMKIKAGVLFASFTVLLFVVVGNYGGVHAASNNDAYRQLQVYSEVLSRIRTEYVEEPNVPKVTDGGLHGLLESLDADSAYISPEAYKKFKEHKAEGKATIGAVVSKRFGYAAVVSVIPGSPADHAGLSAGDVFESIDGISTRDLSVPEIRSMLTGATGSAVNAEVVRARRAEPQKMSIQRAMVSAPALEDKMLEDGVGYIRVGALAHGRAQEVAARIKALEKTGAKRLVLDLRGCAEGDESEGVAVANLFLNHGTIAYLQGQKYPKETYTADPIKSVTQLPLAVLVNRGTSGAAELVAASLMENARADVVGDKTFGEGSVQKTIDLPDGGVLILSVAKYYSPSGKTLQDTGVTPNVIVSDEEELAVVDEDESGVRPAETNEKPKATSDDQLKKALEVLKKRAS